VYLSQGRCAAAISAFRDSLRYRPKSPATLLQLGYALRADHQPGAAVAVWREALDLAPGYAPAVAAIHATPA
jgi:cytochrome c-type biogenesis protein CcmH/NrfG